MRARTRTITLTAILVTGILITALCLNAGRIGLYAASRTCGVDVTFGTMKNESLRQYDFTDFVLNDIKTGIGLRAKRATVRPLWHDIMAGKVAIDFRLSEVNFIQRKGEAPEDYETFDGLAALPFSSQRTYLNLTGALETTGPDAIHLQDLKAVSELIKFTITGDIREDASIDADITIYLADRLFEKVPKNIIKGVLANEGDGWKSFSMKLTGNYKQPTIQVTGKQFRLNISQLSVP